MSRVDLTSRERTLLAERESQARFMALTIGEEIRKYRVRAGMSQWDLANRLDMTQSTISEWETGARMVQLDNLLLLCIVLGIPFQFGEPF